MFSFFSKKPTKPDKPQIDFRTKVYNVFDPVDIKLLSNLNINDIVSSLKAEGGCIDYVCTLLGTKEVAASKYKEQLKALAAEYAQSKEGKKRKEFVSWEKILQW